MQRILIIMCVFETRMCTRYGTGWTYDDEGKWPGELCHNGGEVQSPIDIITKDAILDVKNQFIEGPLQFSGYTKVLLSGKNNDGNLQFTCDGPRSIHPVLTGGPLKHNYRLEQLHFHAISEHAMNGLKYPLEIHLVHIRNDLTVGEAIQSSDGLAVIAVFCNVQVVDDYQVSGLEELLPYILTLDVPGKQLSGVLVDLIRIIPEKKDSYYTYAGSLTSPTCNEAVIWIVYDTPIIMSDLQYDLLSQADRGANFRSLQPLRGHQVYRPHTHVFKTPRVIEIFHEMIKVLRGAYP